MTPSDWPKPAPTRPWPSFRRVHPILAAHPPEGYPIFFPYPKVAGLFGQNPFTVLLSLKLSPQIEKEFILKSFNNILKIAIKQINDRTKL